MDAFRKWAHAQAQDTSASGT